MPGQTQWQFPFSESITAECVAVCVVTSAEKHKLTICGCWENQFPYNTSTDNERKREKGDQMQSNSGPDNNNKYFSGA